jgi:SHS family sialic acid transporter-like MFS transporter
MTSDTVRLEPNLTQTPQDPPLTGAQWIVLAASFLGWMFDGVQIGLFPVLMRPALQSMGITSDADIGAWASYLNASFLLGAAAGGIGFGWLGDKIGRVRSMVISILFYSLFTGACYFAQSPLQLAVLRFLASLGMGGQWSLAVALVMECWPQRHRPKLAGAIGAAANFGILFIAVICLIKTVTQEDWRWICLVAASPAVLAFVIILFVPESEKWKASAKQAKGNPLVEIFGPKLVRFTFTAAILSAIPLIGTWAAVSGYIPTWVDQMTQAEKARGFLDAEQIKEYQEAPNNPTARQTVLKKHLTDAQWKEVRSSTARPKAWIQVIMGIGAIIACFIAPVIGQLWGRRPVYFGLSLCSLVLCMYLFRFLNQFDVQFMIVAGVTGGVTAAFYGWLPLYLPELFPTRVRATGQGLSFNIGRVLAAAGTLLMGKFVSLFDGDYGMAMAAITLVYLVGLVVIWIAPETKGKPLPE